MTFTEREERQAYAAAWLREMGGTCPEVPRDVRAGWAAVAGMKNERLAERVNPQELSTCA